MPEKTTGIFEKTDRPQPEIKTRGRPQAKGRGSGGGGVDAEAIKKDAQLTRQGAAVTQRFLDIEQKFNKESETLTKLLARKKISVETFDRAMMDLITTTGELIDKEEALSQKGLKLEQQFDTAASLRANEKEIEVLLRRDQILQDSIQPLKQFKEEQADLFSIIADGLGNIDLTETFNPEQMEAFVENTEKAGLNMQRLGEIMQKNAENAEAGGLDLGQQFPEGDPEKNEAFFENLQNRLEILTEFVDLEENLELQSHLRRLEELQSFVDEGLIIEDERRSLQLALEAEHQQKIAEIRKRSLTKLEKFNAMSFANQTSDVLGEMVNITQGVARESKTLFEINKIAAIGQAVVNTALGISRTLAEYPFPLSVAMAGLQAAAAIVQVNAIRSQTFGGGGAAPSLAGATAAPPVSNVGGTTGGGDTGQNVFINLKGDTFTQESVRALIKEINEATKNGAHIQIN